MRLLFLILLFFANNLQSQIIRANPYYSPVTATAGASYILDDVTGAKQAYSFRKLRSAYSGSAIRVRRSNDNTEQDIGFVSDTLDLASLTSFVGANSGYIVTWYDQTTNGLNATNATQAKQPRIINAGALETINGKVAMYCDGADQLTFTLQTYGDLTFTTVTKKSSTSGNNGILWGHSTNNNYFGGDDVLNAGNPTLYTITGYIITGANTSASGGEINLHLSYYNRVGASCNGGLNGEVKTPTTTFSTNWLTNQLFQYHTGATVHEYDGLVQELIMYDSNKGANRTTLETNINNYYVIY